MSLHELIVKNYCRFTQKELEENIKNLTNCLDKKDPLIQKVLKAYQTLLATKAYVA